MSAIKEVNKCTYYALKQKLSGLQMIQMFHNRALNILLAEEKREIEKLKMIRREDIMHHNQASLELDQKISQVKALITAYETDEIEAEYQDSLLDIMLLIEEQLKGNHDAS